MDLTDRKKRILRAIIDNYIESAEPVGSKTIAESSGLDVSSATVRNEMADLEAMGYLEQPHTSSGRIPSPKGYRLYVNELMGDYRLSVQETQRINQALRMKMQELDRVIDQAGRIVSQLTQYPRLRPLLRHGAGDHQAVRPADGGAKRLYHRGDDGHQRGPQPAGAAAH